MKEVKPKIIKLNLQSMLIHLRINIMDILINIINI